MNQGTAANMKEAARLIEQEEKDYMKDYIKRQIELDQRLTKIERRIAKLERSLA